MNQPQRASAFAGLIPADTAKWFVTRRLSAGQDF
jgi:hypothetical protein